MIDEKNKVSESMRKMGGSFAQKLGEALAVADSENTKKIKDTWPEMWEKYLAFSEADR